MGEWAWENGRCPGENIMASCKVLHLSSVNPAGDGGTTPPPRLDWSFPDSIDKESPPYDFIGPCLDSTICCYCSFTDSVIRGSRPNMFLLVHPWHCSYRVSPYDFIDPSLKVLLGGVFPTLLRWCFPDKCYWRSLTIWLHWSIPENIIRGSLPHITSLVLPWQVLLEESPHMTSLIHPWKYY